MADCGKGSVTRVIRIERVGPVLVGFDDGRPGRPAEVHPAVSFSDQFAGALVGDLCAQLLRIHRSDLRALGLHRLGFQPLGLQVEQVSLGLFQFRRQV